MRDSIFIKNGNYCWFGKRPSDEMSVMLNADNNINKTSNIEQAYIGHVTGTSLLDNVNVKITPVNFLPFYWVMGDYTGASATSGVIKLHGRGQPKPTVDIHTENGTRYLYASGCVFHDLSLDFDNASEGVVISLQGKGKSWGKESQQISGAIYPSSQSEHLTNIGSVTWSGTTDGLVSLGNVINLKLSLTSELKGFINTNGFYDSFNDQAPIYSTVSMYLDGQSNIFLDTVKENGQQGTLSFKIFSKNYQGTIYCSNAYPFAYKEEYSIKGKTESVVGFAVEDITIQKDDGVTGSYYVA